MSAAACSTPSAGSAGIASTASTNTRLPPLPLLVRARADVELKTFVRDRQALFFTFALPVLLLLICSVVYYIGPNQPLLTSALDYPIYGTPLTLAISS